VFFFVWICSPDFWACDEEAKVKRLDQASAGVFLMDS